MEIRWTRSGKKGRGEFREQKVKAVVARQGEEYECRRARVVNSTDLFGGSWVAFEFRSLRRERGNIAPIVVMIATVERGGVTGEKRARHRL